METPVARASLREGETVVDFGSGGGIDCFMAAQAVGPTGRAIGIDMTQDMIKLARSNATKVGATNVEFHLAEMESTPLEDSSVDVVISNCVISLSPDKDAVFTEAFRILRSGGRLCVSDTILTEESPAVSDSSPENWVPAGEEPRPVYMERLHRIGFQDIEIISEEPYDNDAFPNLASFTYTAYKPA